MGKVEEKGGNRNRWLPQDKNDCGGAKEVNVCKWSDIGLSFSQYSTKEIAMKLNIITKTQFQDDKIEETIMDKCSLKYTAEKNDKTTKSCIARLITEQLSYLVS